jgi:hypothetical protein|tara:strand:- start:220 stop:546 length:327 start_codon:yes stop_codon:yes gene_type:complete
MSEIKLSPEQLDDIATAVHAKIVKAPQPPEPEDGTKIDSTTGEVIYLDESVKVADEVEQDLMQCLPRGLKAYKGKGGVQIVNHTVESMNYINDWRRNRKNMYTRTNVR